MTIVTKRADEISRQWERDDRPARRRRSQSATAPRRRSAGRSLGARTAGACVADGHRPGLCRQDRADRRPCAGNQRERRGRPATIVRLADAGPIDADERHLAAMSSPSRRDDRRRAVRGRSGFARAGSRRDQAASSQPASRSTSFSTRRTSSMHPIATPSWFRSAPKCRPDFPPATWFRSRRRQVRSSAKSRMRAARCGSNCAGRRPNLRALTNLLARVFPPSPGRPLRFEADV